MEYNAMERWATYWIAYDLQFWMDLNAIKSNRLIATEENNTFVSISAELIADLANLNVKSTTIIVTEYTPDTTDPTLEGFELNINEGTLTLSFSEAIDPNITDVTQILLQDTMDHNYEDHLQLRPDDFSIGSAEYRR